MTALDKARREAAIAADKALVIVTVTAAGMSGIFRVGPEDLDELVYWLAVHARAKEPEPCNKK